MTLVHSQISKVNTQRASLSIRFNVSWGESATQEVAVSTMGKMNMARCPIQCRIHFAKFGFACCAADRIGHIALRKLSKVPLSEHVVIHGVACSNYRCSYG